MSDPSAEVAAPAFVGRGRETAVLAGALAQPPAMVLLEGEAGIGKSRLIHEHVAAGPLGALVATCPPFQESLTLGPIVDAVRQSRAGAGLSGMRVSSLVGALRPLFPEWSADLPPAPEPLDDPKAALHRSFSALAELIGHLRVRVLVVEDVHWADRATLEFLLFLVARRRPALSLVLSYRPEDVAAGSLLLRLSSRLPAGWTQVRLTLPPLDVTATAGLVSSMLGGEQVSDEFAAFLHDRTDGVPLAVEESVRLLRQRDDVVRHDGEWIRRSLDELAVPPTVRDSVLERAQRLGPAARRAVEAAAVLAGPAEERLIAEVAGLAPADARAALAEAVRSGLLADDDRGGLAFRHVLVGRAVYDAMTGVEQRRLHHRAGEALERQQPWPVVQLSRHFQAAQEFGKWCTYAELAADHAGASGDHTTAVTLIVRLLATAPLGTPAAVPLAIKLATAATARREPVDDLHHEVIRTLRDVLDRGDLAPRSQAEIRNPLGRLLLQAREFEQAHAELSRAVPDLAHDPVEAARAMTYLGYPLQGPWPAAVHLRWLEQAARVAPGIGTPVDRLALTADRAAALLALGQEDGWAVAAELPNAVTDAEERRQLARGLSNIAYVATGWGRYAYAEARLAAATELARLTGYVRLHASAQAMRAQLDWYTGRWTGLADRVAALIAASDLETSGSLEPFLVDGLLHAAGGSSRRAEQRFRDLLTDAPVDSIAALPVTPAAALATLRLAAGDVDGAAEVTDEPMRTIATKQMWVWASDLARVRLDVLLAAGRAAGAADLLAAFEQGLGDVDAPAPRAALLTCRAALLAAGGEPDGAAAGYAEAAAAWQALPRPYDAALTLERQARSLLDAGRADAGAALLSDVFHTLAELGARTDAARVGTGLRELGVEVRRTWRRGRRGYGDQLSPRELEVARLVATGRTNREIADALSRSPKTVAAQLNSAMRKLGVTSRTALAVKAIEAGLLPGDKD
ncbi:ATP-binding protein [Jiangella alkaliphila]|uniref:AAA ATPase domain-containing protein n=1 Tax=Jiangella alkaliphila TaxID=419479 RepID=A0A1H2JZ77_9ACTN|nr:helix-turn-helix transcriptional regulator [Jiangella alkaliphila]SDU61759.1 AAA ATPase domain-containing protein [Jiangella alkaliphila]